MAGAYHTRRGTAVCCLWAGLIVAGASTAQAEAPAAQLYVNDTIEGLRQLESAAELDSQRRWAEAADVYDRALTQNGSKLVRRSPPPAARSRDPAWFVNVPEAVLQRLQQWPEEGQRALREWCQHRPDASLSRLYYRMREKPASRPAAAEPASSSVIPANLTWHFPPTGIERLKPETRAEETGGLFAVAAAGRVYIRGGASVWAVSPVSGRVFWTQPLNAPMSHAVAPAALGPDLLALSSNQEGRDTLVLLEGSGKTRWVLPVEDLTSAAAAAGRIRIWNIMAARDRALILISTNPQAAITDYYLVAIDPATGSSAWQSHLVSAVGGVTSGRAVLSGNDVYIWISAGALIRASATNGLVRWIRTGLPENPATDTVLNVEGVNPGTALLANPRFALRFTTDGQLAGELPRPLKSSPYLANAGHALFAVGNDIAAYDPAGSRLLWRAGLDAAAVGQPLVMGGIIAVPTNAGLRWITLNGAQRGGSQWPPNFQPEGCTLLAGNDRLLVIGKKRVLCYAGGDALAGLLTRTTREQDNCALHLDIATLALAREESFDAGLRALNAALECGGQSIGESVLEVALTGAAALVKPPQSSLPAATQPAETSRAAALMEVARSAATTPVQQVRLRLAFANLFAQLGQPRIAVRLYQEILSDDTLRELRYNDQKAGTAAQTGIAGLIEDFGNEVYAAYQREAAAMLAKAALRAPSLRRLAAQFPNSSAAEAALLELAELTRREGQPLEAAAIIEDALLRPDTERTVRESPKVLWALARNLQEAGHLSEALSWLKRGEQNFEPQKVTTEDGAVTVSRLRARMLEPSAGAGRSLRPRLVPPLQLSWLIGITSAVLELTSEPADAYLPTGTMLIPPPEPPHGERPQLALVSTQNHLEAWEPVTREVKWINQDTGLHPVSWLASRAGALLLTTPYQVLALDVSTGLLRWSFGTPPKSDVLASTDPEFIPPITRHALGLSRLLIVCGSNMATMLRLEDGAHIWQRKLDLSMTGPLAMNDEHAVYVAIASGQPVIVVLDVLTGKELRRIALPHQQRPHRLDFTPERTVAAAGANWLGCWEPATGQAVWTFDEPAGLHMPSVMVGHQHLYAARLNTTVAAWALKDGRQTWRQQPGIGSAGIIEAWCDDDQIIIASPDGIAALHTTNGRVIWTLKMPPASIIRRALLTASYVLMATAQNGSALPQEDADEITFIDRLTGRLLEERLRLPAEAALDEFIIYDHAALLRYGDSVRAWIDSAARASR